MTTIKFQQEDVAFQQELFRRVHHYFAANQLKKTGNTLLIVKSGVLVLSYLLVYLLLLTATSALVVYGCNMLLGVLTIFVALNIGHDAAHHTFSSNKKYNDWLLYAFDFLGASGYMWRLKHVHSHHPHVNIPNMDGDIKQSNLVRIFPDAQFIHIHRFQHLYMPVLYLFYTLHWLLFRDFKDYWDTNISGKPAVRHSKKEYVRLILGKTFFLSRMLLIPYLLLPFSFGTILSGFLVFHFSASFTVALALVSAHIGQDSVYPKPNNKGQMPTSWIRHQIITTCDFATDSWWLTHFFGGFNHHVVHHLFPTICHVHYPELTKILIRTCRDFDMPYRANSSLLKAVHSHLKFLKIRSLRGERVAYIEM